MFRWKIIWTMILICDMCNYNDFSFSRKNDWKLVLGPFMILSKWHIERSSHFNSWHLPFSIILYSPSEKNETAESWHNWLLSNWRKLLYWNLATVLQIVQKIPENYCPCLYLSIGQVWWLNELWFKRYTQKCTLSHVQYPS